MHNYTAEQKTVMMKEYRRLKQSKLPLTSMVQQHGFKNSSAMLCYLGRWARAAGFESAKIFAQSERPFTIDKDRFETRPVETERVNSRLHYLPWTKVGLEGQLDGSI